MPLRIPSVCDNTSAEQVSIENSSHHTHCRYSWNDHHSLPPSMAWIWIFHIAGHEHDIADNWVDGIFWINPLFHMTSSWRIVWGFLSQLFGQIPCIRLCIRQMPDSVVSLILTCWNVTHSLFGGLMLASNIHSNSFAIGWDSTMRPSCSDLRIHIYQSCCFILFALDDICDI